MKSSLTTWFALGLLAVPAIGFAAEIRFADKAQASRGIVRLGDIAEVVASDANEARLLEGIALVAAPSPGETRQLRRQEAQQLLTLSGINLREHRFSGADVTQILATEAHAAAKPAIVEEVARVIQVEPIVAATERTTPKLASTQITATVEARVGQAIVSHLIRMAEHPADWQVEASLSPRVVQAIGERPIFRVEGGVSPWLGRQQFFVFIGDETNPQRLPVEADISGTTRAATVIRTVERGAIVTASDLEMQTVSMKSGVKLVQDVNQIIGREAARALNAGQVVGSDMFREVRLVRRGDEVQVVSIGAGVQISELGKALGDGSHGETITVEFEDRRKMTARVTGIRRAEVYAMETVRSQVRNTPLK